MRVQDNGNHITFGTHYMVDGYRAPAERLRDRERLTRVLHDLPARLGLHALHEPLVVEVGPNTHGRRDAASTPQHESGASRREG